MQQLVFRESLQDAEIERGAANAAAGKCEAIRLSEVGGVRTRRLIRELAICFCSFFTDVLKGDWEGKIGNLSVRWADYRFEASDGRSLSQLISPRRVEEIYQTRNFLFA